MTSLTYPLLLNRQGCCAELSLTTKHLDGQRDLVSRLIGICRVTIWVIGVINLLTSPPDPPSSTRQCTFTGLVVAALRPAGVLQAFAVPLCFAASCLLMPLNRNTGTQLNLITIHGFPYYPTVNYTPRFPP